MVSALDPNNSVIKRLWCIIKGLWCSKLGSCHIQEAEKGKLQPLYNTIAGVQSNAVLVKQPVIYIQKCTVYMEKWVFKVIFLYNLNIFGANP